MMTTSIEPVRETNALPRWLAFVLIAGLYLTLRGYHAFDGDQAYRLPLWLHAQDPAVYADDPFVRAFDTFNPHRGYLTLVGLASRPLGLAFGLASLFALTFGATAVGVDRLARAVWPSMGGRVGLVAFGLVLLAKAGNVGTNHLFESTLLDRLIGFALGWLAMASAVGDPKRGAWLAPIWLGLATLIHPSVGLQLAMTLGISWVGWGLWSKRSEVGGRLALGAILGLGLGLIPGVWLVGGQGSRLLEGLPSEEFRLLAVMIQGPQHMLPSTWRMPQWLAWGSYLVLGGLAMFGRSGTRWPAARVRLALLIGVNLASLALAYLAVEVVGDLRVTVFQPFRMATLARGLALMAISGRLVMLWDRGDLTSRSRVVLIAVGLSGDWILVVAALVEVGMSLAEAWSRSPRTTGLVGLTILVAGLIFVGRHDLEMGPVPLIAGLGALVAGSFVARRRPMGWTRRRVGWALGVTWVVPVSAALVPMVVADPSAHRWSMALVARCRFAETPTDDLERLAVWCRDHTPASSRFIGPPGPKTFRLWSRRSLAFNRGGSPYHAEGLLDWSSRYRDHVGFQGSTAEFARAYLADRHGLEAGYHAMTPAGRAALARRQEADYVLAAAPGPSENLDGPLELIRVDGRYAVYRVRPGNDLGHPGPPSVDNSRKILPVSLFNQN